jgi:type III secretion protein V
MRVINPRKAFATRDIGAILSRHADVGIGLVLLSVLALLVLPLPVIAIDVAIALNMSFAILLLASTLYIRSPLDMATFPSLLLMTTLFRLGLAVATTKMILLHGYAGDIVETFGRLVVGGNLVVGLVIFAVLCVVQFMVVAKGSDRIAEVSARFTLDAIPGKQMSIDADLRAGSITGSEASEKRKTLQREIQMHGALDGAMKFVKGDAMVGLLVALVNIVGGIVIGMAGRGMSLAEAGKTYIVLTVGDGLVSQVPSLIVAIAAGLLITRGEADEGAANNLGARVLGELTARARPAFMAGVAALLFALVPGFPHLVFLGAAACFFAMGISLRRREEKAIPAASNVVPNMTRAGARYTMGMLDDVDMGTASPLAIRIGQEAFAALPSSVFDQALGDMRQRLAEGLGVPFPGVSLRGDGSLEGTRYCIEVEGAAVAEGQLYRGRAFVVGASADALDGEWDDAVAQDIPDIGSGVWVSSGVATTLGREGAYVYSASDIVTARLLAVCHARAATFMGTQEASHLLERLGVFFPQLVEALALTTGPTDFSAVLRSLLDEKVAIRNLRAIVEGIVSLPPAQRQHARMVRAARVALGRQISRQWMNASGQLAVVTLDDDLARLLDDALASTDSGATARLELDTVAIDRVERSFRQASYVLQAPDAVLVTTGALREHVVGLLRSVSLEVPVLGMDEVPYAEVPLSRLGAVELLA